MTKDWFEGRSLDEKLGRCYLRRLVWGALAALMLAGVAMCATKAYGQDLDKPMLVVATEKLDGDRLFRRTVMLAVPVGALHVGVILNRPSPNKMGDIFPEHPASKAVTDPIYIGGPSNSQALFAMVKADISPGPRSLLLMPGLWLAVNADVIDHIIETKPNEARYYAGTVVWRQGELEKELRERAVVLRPVDEAKLFLKDTSTLHEELAPKKGVVES